MRNRHGQLGRFFPLKTPCDIPNGDRRDDTILHGTVSRRWSVVVEIGLGLTIIACLASIDPLRGGPLQAVRDWVFDSYQQLWLPERAGAETVLVEVDDDSIRRIGQWPWPRSRLAELVEAARGARAIGIDILMPEADRLEPETIARALHIEAPALRRSLLDLPDPDADLAAAMRALPTVLAVSTDNAISNAPPEHAVSTPVREHGDPQRPVLTQAVGVSWPLAKLARAAHAMGVISVVRSRSGEIDELPSVVEVGHTIVPGFALELLAVAKRDQAIVLNTSPTNVTSVAVGELTIATGRSGGIRPRFTDPARLMRIPAYRLLEPDYDRSMMLNRIVIIGVTATGIAETFATPLGSWQSGAAIQAELIESMLAGDTLSRPFWAGFVEGSSGFALGLATILLCRRTPWLVHIAVFALVILLLIGGSVWLFWRHRILWDWSFPTLCMLLTYGIALAGRIRNEIAIRRQRDAELIVAHVQRTAAEREAELRIEADRLRQSLDFAVDAAQLGVWDADLLRGTWLHSARHDAILSLTDPPSAWTPAVLLGRIIPEDLAAARTQLNAAQTSGTLQLECRITWRDGSLHHIHVLGQFWRGPENTLRRVAGVVADITQQRTLEQRLRHTEKMQAVGMLAGGVAHNFNNLLTVVLGSLELVARKVDGSRGTGELIANAINASRKCAEIARHLLAFARLQPLQPKTVDPLNLLRNICQMISGAMPDRVRLHLHTPRELGEIRLDAVEFELALLNLAINARDAMPNGGHIDITARIERVHDGRHGLNGHYLVVAVVDTGMGISMDILPNVFEPFFTTKDVGKGTGLGLSQVHGFAHQSGGAVEIDSTPGQGTSVRLYLPASDPVTQPVPSFGTDRFQ